MPRAVRAILPTLTCLLALAASAQQIRPPDPPEELSSDRPDFTESTDTIARGVMQLEGGFLATSDALAGGSSHGISLPLALLRIGLNRRLELRLGVDGFERQTSFAGGLRQRHSGFADTSVGMKARLIREGSLRPAVSLVALLSLPVGSRYFSSGSFDPEFKLAWSKSFPRGFDAGGNFNFGWRTGGPRWASERAASLSVGHKIPAGLRAYTEVYRTSPVAGDEAAHVVLDGGLTRLIGANAQIDAEVGHTLGARTPGWFLGVGFVVRR